MKNCTCFKGSLGHVQERLSKGSSIGQATPFGQGDDLGATIEPFEGHVAHQEGDGATDDHHVHPQQSMPCEANDQGRQGYAHATQATTFI